MWEFWHLDGQKIRHHFSLKKQRQGKKVRILSFLHNFAAILETNRSDFTKPTRGLFLQLIDYHLFRL
jgi:hypothetical protein